MAYKFQLGAAILSGSLTQEGQVLAKDSKISGSSIGLTDASGLAEAGGGIANADGKLELSIGGMDGESFDVSQDKIFFSAVSGAAGNIRSGSLADLATGFAGNGIVASSGSLAVNTNGNSINNGVSGISVNVAGLAGAGLVENSGVFDVGAGNGIAVGGNEVAINLSGSNSGLNLNSDGLAIKLSGSGGLGADANGVFIALPAGAGLELEPGGLKIETGGVTNDMLSGSIGNAKLSFSDITVGTTAIALGASSTTLAGMTGIDFAASDASIAASIGANTLTLGGASTTVRVAGDLDVVGTLNRVTETELLIEDKVVIVASGSLNAAAAVGAGLKVDIATGDMAFLYRNSGFGDASSSGDIWVASGSAGLIDIQAENFYGNGSNLTGVSADTILYSVALKGNGNTLEENKVNIFNTLSSSATVTMPGVTDDDIGSQLFIKARDLTNSATITINTANAAQKIDGQDSIVLESPYAAVTLIYVNTDNWAVF